MTSFRQSDNIIALWVKVRVTVRAGVSENTFSIKCSRSDSTVQCLIQKVESIFHQVIYARS